MNANCFTTAGDALTVSALIADFLRHPVVEVRTAPSDEITRLRASLDAVQDENARLAFLYDREVQICLRYEDYLKSIGVDPREVR